VRADFSALPSSSAVTLNDIFGPRRRVPKATLVVLLVVLGIGSLQIPKAFLIHSAAQQSFAYAFVLTFCTDLPSQIFKLISN